MRTAQEEFAEREKTSTLVARRRPIATLRYVLMI
jgi:hypothetical protein